MTAFVVLALIVGVVSIGEGSGQGYDDEATTLDAGQGPGITVEYAGITETISFGRLRQELTTATITLQNPHYKRKTRTYEGFWLEDVLGYVSLDQGDVLVFVTLDDYEAHITLDRLHSVAERGFIAYREIGHDVGIDRDFAPLASVDPWPYWLLWVPAFSTIVSNEYELPGDLPWPYQVVGIQLVSVI